MRYHLTDIYSILNESFGVKKKTLSWHKFRIVYVKMQIHFALTFDDVLLTPTETREGDKFVVTYSILDVIDVHIIQIIKRRLWCQQASERPLMITLTGASW